LSEDLGPAAVERLRRAIGELMLPVLRATNRVVTSRGAWRWCAEIAGVGAMAIAAWMVHAAAGVAVVGLYLIVVANSGGGDNASS